MKFPEEFPVLAIRQLGKLTTGTDPDKGRAALAGWELLGFGLKQVFGDAAYLMESGDPEQEFQQAVAQAPPEVQQAVQWLQANQSGPNQAIPPILIPIILRGVEWLAKYIFERLNRNP